MVTLLKALVVGTVEAVLDHADNGPPSTAPQLGNEGRSLAQPPTCSPTPPAHGPSHRGSSPCRGSRAVWTGLPTSFQVGADRTVTLQYPEGEPGDAERRRTAQQRPRESRADAASMSEPPRHVEFRGTRCSANAHRTGGPRPTVAATALAAAAVRPVVQVIVVGFRRHRDLPAAWGCRSDSRCADVLVSRASPATIAADGDRSPTAQDQHIRRRQHTSR